MVRWKAWWSRWASRIRGFVGALLALIGLVDLPENIGKWRRVVSAAADYASGFSVFQLFAVLIGLGLLLSTVPQNTWSRLLWWRGSAERDVKYLGPSPVGGDDPPWMIFAVGHVLKALHVQAYLYYSELSPELKRKVHDYIATNNSLKFYRWDMLKATDRPEFTREALGHYVMEGTDLCQRLRQFGQEEGPGVSLLGQKVSERQVSYWERTVVDLLKSYRRSSESDFMRDLGAVPYGTPVLLHRVETRVERLQKIKDQV